MGKISTCQANIVTLLSNDSFFNNVPIISKRAGDIEGKIKENLVKTGVGLIVLLKGVTLPERTPALTVDLQFALSAIENVTFNKTGKAAEDVVEEAAKVLEWASNGVVPGDETDRGRFTVDPKAIGPLPAPPNNPFLNIQVLLINTSVDIK